MEYFNLLENSEKELKSFLDSFKYIVLYGNKFIGHYYLNYIRTFGIEPDAFVVSEQSMLGECSDRALDNGLPVYAISELPYPANETGVIVSLSAAHSIRVLELLDSLGFKNRYTVIQPGDILPAAQTLENLRILQGYCNAHNIDLSSPYIDIAGFRTPNFFENANVNICESFLFALVDLILPSQKVLGGIWEGPYEYKNICLGTNDVVIDCGSNIGIFSAYACGKGCTVHAFEPDKAIIPELEKTKAIYPEQISICPYFISDIDDKEKANITIDSYVQEHTLDKVDFIKADIEGAERTMLEGAQQTLARFSPKLSICTYHLADDAVVLEEIIKSANPQYKVIHHWKKLFAYV